MKKCDENKDGVDVMLVTLIGNDTAGESLLHEWKTQLGLTTKGILLSAHARTPTLVSVIEHASGEVVCSVADVVSLERNFSEKMYGVSLLLSLSQSYCMYIFLWCVQQLIYTFLISLL